MEKPIISWADFEKIEIRVGTVLSAEPFPEARKPAYKMTLDLGPSGIKHTSAQITARYRMNKLVGRQVLAVINFPPKWIAGFRSEVLVLGAVPIGGDVILIKPDVNVPNGTRVF